MPGFPSPVSHAFMSSERPVNNRESRRSLAELLREATAAYQDANVIPHCKRCAQPCCKLESLVLELNWKQVKVFWRLDESRAAFDRQLEAGKGPQEIRAGNGLYYAHQKPCPAYDEAQGTCSVYNQPLKPAGCSDFPIYEDGNLVTADLRCEAVDVDALTAWISRALGPEYRIVRSADRDFPFLISLAIRRTGPGRKPGEGRSGSKAPRRR